MADPPAATRPPARPSYGIDGPDRLIGLSAVAIFAVLVGFFFAAGRSPRLSIVAWALATVLVIAVAWTAHGTRRAKPMAWHRVLDGLDLAGDEQALDLGCGRGLVLVETARRLPRGHATGVDIWRSRDLSGNRRSSAELNAGIEGVAERVTVLDADMTKLPHDDGSFDLVTASFSLRSLAVPAERAQALDEAVRVLRPGGHLVVLDDAHTATIAAHLREHGLHHVVRSGLLLGFAPPARVISARRG